jgi:hypothetical protein
MITSLVKYMDIYAVLNGLERGIIENDKDATRSNLEQLQDLLIAKDMLGE